MLPQNLFIYLLTLILDCTQNFVQFFMDVLKLLVQSFSIFAPKFVTIKFLQTQLRTFGTKKSTNFLIPFHNKFYKLYQTFAKTILQQPLIFQPIFSTFFRLFGKNLVTSFPLGCFRRTEF